MLLGVLTLFTVLTWVAFDVYRAFRKATPPQIPKEQLEPLEPKLETSIINALTARPFFNKEDLNLSALPTPAATGTESGKLKKQ